MGYLLEKRCVLCRVKAKNTDKNMKPRVRFFGKTRKKILESKNGFCVFWGKSKIHTRGGYFGLNLNPDF